MIPLSSYIYGLLASISGALGALFLKKGAKSFSFKKFINSNLFVGFLLYALTTVFMILGLQNSPLSFLYPFTALLYIFAVILGYFVLKEKITSYKMFALCLILFGILLNSIGR